MKWNLLFFALTFSFVTEGIQFKKVDTKVQPSPPPVQSTKSKSSCFGIFSRDFNQILITGIESGDLSKVKKAIKKRADINGRVYLGQTALSFSLQKNNMEAFRLLIESGASPNEVNMTGFSPLSLAIRSNQVEAAQLLIKSPNIDMSLIDKSGISFLSNAILQKAHEIVKAILEHPDIDPNAPDTNNKLPLHLASEANNVEAIEALMATGKVDINQKDAKNLTAIQYALQNKHKEAAAALTNHGAIFRPTITEPVIKPGSTTPSRVPEHAPGYYQSGQGQNPISFHPENPRQRTYGHEEPAIEWGQAGKNLKKLVGLEGVDITTEGKNLLDGLFGKAKKRITDAREELGLAPPKDSENQ